MNRLSRWTSRSQTGGERPYGIAVSEDRLFVGAVDRDRFVPIAAHFKNGAGSYGAVSPR